MRLINVERIAKDTRLAKNIYRNGTLLLSKNCTDLYKYRNKLLTFGIHHVYIDDPRTEGIDVNDVIKEETKLRSREIIKKTFENIISKGTLEVEESKKMVMNIVEEILSSKELMHNLVDIKTSDSYTFSHSVNIATLSIMLGKTLNMDRTRLLDLGMGAIMHDVGKMLIPQEILNKTAKLTEEEFNIIKQHTTLGAEYIKEKSYLNSLVRVSIKAHHERIDGTGYPDKKVSDEIHPYARIVAIADVFDALTSDRCYRNKWPTHKALDFIVTNAGTQFDRDYVEKFIRSIAVYPNGTEILLSDGSKAVVERQNREFPLRPVVRIIEDKSGNPVSKSIDLIKTLNIVIQDVIL